MLTLTPGTERRIRREVRSATLRERALALRQIDWTLQAIAVALGVSPTRVRQILHKGERLVRDPHWYDALPMRAQTYLRTSGLASLPEIEAAHRIAKLSRRELLATPNIGHGAHAAIIGWLAGHGLALLPPTMSRKKLAGITATPANADCLLLSPNKESQQHHARRTPK